MEIRLAREVDIAEILVLQLQIYRTDKLAGGAPEMLKSQLKDDSCDVLVVEDGGKIIATATVYYVQIAAHGRPYAFLEGLVVEGRQRGKGVGTAFFKKIIEVARAKNCRKLLFTSGFDREDVHKFYEKLGFKKWGYEFRLDL